MDSTNRSTGEQKSLGGSIAGPGKKDHKLSTRNDKQTRTPAPWKPKSRKYRLNEQRYTEMGGSNATGILHDCMDNLAHWRTSLLPVTLIDLT
jgi:hypothetical protein